MRKLNKILAGVSVAVLASFNTQAACVPADCNAMGYTKSASDCDGSDMIKCPFDTDKVWCTEGSDVSTMAPAIGAIYYSDGTFSTELNPKKNAVGIVAYMNGNRRLVIAFDEQSKLWGGYAVNEACLTDYGSSDNAKTDFNGLMNTLCLVNAGNRPAAEYCNSYKPVSSGAGSIGWYLPAAGELNGISSNYNAINSALQKLSKTKLSTDYYWTSSEIEAGTSWYAKFATGDVHYGDGKNQSHLTRCVLAF